MNDAASETTSEPERADPFLTSAVTVPVNELFATMQWVGTHAGSPVVVVRTQGCGVGCRYCDVPETWHNPRAVFRAESRRRPKRWRDMAAEEVLEWAATEHKALRHVVITGGDPALHPGTGELAAVMLAAGYFVQYETSATYRLPVNLPAAVWVTASPKFAMAAGREVLPEVLTRADEVVMPLSREKDLAALQRHVIPVIRRGVPVYLHPIHGGNLCGEVVKTAFSRGYKVTARVNELVK